MIAATLDTPIGELLLVGDGRAVHEIRFAGEDASRLQRDAATFADARAQLAEYFAGRRTGFDLPLAPAGTPFQRRVWEELGRIPYGETISYAELARRIGRPTAVRAVGHANGRNPIPVVVPCHRVVGSDGTLTGYGGGLERKRLLLELEAATSRRVAAPRS
ncbi:MAG TPA: methylated-DNA--[protein]-cysteine S-methyltransferase [Gaiellaceae bacterium]|nr:methylated-DNA--[protein]-cysteine S-methyltransferase [Gaiellaceae bacterium]